MHQESAKPGCWPEMLEQLTDDMWRKLDDWEPVPTPEVQL
jgi:hypothetical protein